MFFTLNTGSDLVRHILKQSLIGNIKYNDPGVFRRLDISNTSNVCDDEIRLLSAAHKDDIKLYKRLSRIAEYSGLTMERGEIYHKDWKDGEESIELYQVERQMQETLMRLLRGVTESSNPTSNDIPPKRVFRPADRMSEDLVFLPTRTIQLAPEIECVTISTNESDVRNYSVRDFFVKVESSCKKGPNVSRPEDIPNMVFRSFEQASYMMNNRPFFLFCVGFLIFGTKFCVGVFDRQGVVFSGVYDMFGRWDVFVRVVRSLTCVLSIHELGLDPTVRMLTEEETMIVTGKKQDHPSAIISVPSIGIPTTEWCTIGRPIWTESSFLQGGTNIWQVKQCYIGNTGERKLKDVEMILKTSWRNSTRDSECDIYHHLQGILPNIDGIAKFECGGDVMFLESTIPITIHNLRAYPRCSDIISRNEPTQVLHRLVINTVCDALWNYRDELQLLRAFRDALLVHKGLSDHGVLHREITPWNILLSRTPIDGSYAFLTGLNVAQLPHGNDSGHVSGRNVQGAVQFMDTRLVELEWNRKDKVRHSVHHDIESFIWVLHFVVLYWLLTQVKDDHNHVHGVNVKAEESELERILTEVFTQQNHSGILQKRDFWALYYPFVHSWEIQNTVKELMSPQFIQLFDSFKHLLAHYYFAPSSECLTYETVLEVVNKALSSME